MDVDENVVVLRVVSRLLLRVVKVVDSSAISSKNRKKQCNALEITTPSFLYWHLVDGVAVAVTGSGFWLLEPFIRILKFVFSLDPTNLYLCRLVVLTSVSPNPVVFCTKFETISFNGCRNKSHFLRASPNPDADSVLHC